MKNIKITPMQLIKLIKNDRIFLYDDTVIELFLNEIIFNKNGKIKKLKELSLEFGKEEKDVPSLRKLICDYFNCKPFEIICTRISDDDVSFCCRFTNKKEMGIIVVTEPMARFNMRNYSNIDNLTAKDQIGIYRRLGKSNYFFRWEDEYFT